MTLDLHTSSLCGAWLNTQKMFSLRVRDYEPIFLENFLSWKIDTYALSYICCTGTRKKYGSFVY